MQTIYLDYNATTPVDREVADFMVPYLYEHFGNPSSSHSFGAKTRLAVETARSQVADLIGCLPSELIFTSGGTESNNYAIKGTAHANRQRGNHIVTSAVEHPAVLEVCGWLAGQGFEITILPVDEFGLVNPADLEAVIRLNTLLVSVMHANNETGAVQPIRELAEIAHAHGALMHTDAAQSVGKLPVRVAELGVDLLSIAGHKVYAPKGIGALYIRSGVKLEKFVHGANHESNQRAGTENVLEIVGLGKACEIAGRDLQRNMAHFQKMRDRLHEGLITELGEKYLRLNGHPEKRLPNTLNLSFYQIEANTLLSEIGEAVAASAGAACHAESVTVSSVLEAMQVPLDWAMGTLRFSVGRSTTTEEIDKAVQVISKAVKRLSSFSGNEEQPDLPAAADVRLTRYTHGLGCACKMRPQVLEKVLGKLSRTCDPRVMVGPETADDAAVYRLDSQQAIVQTVDFFTPVVDDPYWFGAISAANSLSDIYAMGADPIFALSIVGFPTNRLPVEVLELILKGAQDKAAEAGIEIIGGHTIDDTEPKYGLAVTGLVDPESVFRNSTARVGDELYLTKPLGMGILTTAIKRGLADEDLTRKVTGWMALLNKEPSAAARKSGVNALTDVTGFGLLGHLLEMARGSGVNVEIKLSQVPILDEARRLAGANLIPGGSLDNLAYVKPFVDFAEEIPESERLILADAQTSGGLLLSLPAENARTFCEIMRESPPHMAVRIGRVISEGEGRLSVLY